MSKRYHEFMLATQSWVALILFSEALLGWGFWKGCIAHNEPR
jgi:hypothetical protein